MRRSPKNLYNFIRRRIYSSAGFTLVELIVVLVISAILLGLGAWGLLAWHDHSEYIKNEETARTLFLAAQSALSESDSLGRLDSDFKTIEADMASIDETYLPADALKPDAQGI
ncbi:MAG: prepilin-type N-terminal cleavage/methylation domain-containing protein, partial [Lachnospiraceae bacterium]|nr:prepilin-type N-terminal cleavage/methylation domain-containing protein [Lachnospiraceae bacterium]